MTHRPAAPLIRLFLRATGYGAVTMPWRVVHYRDWPPPAGLMAHESIHLEQIGRYGPWGFAARYLWGLIRHGYERHPMEIEARERSGYR